MMNKLIKALCLSIVLSVAVFAQTDAGATDDDYNKNEFYVGYSNGQVGGGNRTTFHGFEGSYTRNITRYLGIRGTVSGAYDNSTIVFPAFGVNGTFALENKRSVHQFLGGVQFKDNASKARFKPFAFAMGGVAVNRSAFKTPICVAGNCSGTVIPFPSNTAFTDTGIAGSFGGGLDVKLYKKIDLRLIQVDYNPIYSNSRVDNNFRIGAGIVFK